MATEVLAWRLQVDELIVAEAPGCSHAQFQMLKNKCQLVTVFLIYQDSRKHSWDDDVHMTKLNAKDT